MCVASLPSSAEETGPRGLAFFFCFVFNAVHPKEIHLGVLYSLIHHLISFLYLLLSWEVYIN